MSIGRIHHVVGMMPTTDQDSPDIINALILFSNSQNTPSLTTSASSASLNLKRHHPHTLSVPRSRTILHTSNLFPVYYDTPSTGRVSTPAHSSQSQAYSRHAHTVDSSTSPYISHPPRLSSSSATQQVPASGPSPLAFPLVPISFYPLS